MSRRMRIKHTLSFSKRLENEAARLREMADSLPPGAKHDELVAKAAQMDSAREIDDWLRSSVPVPAA